MSAPPLTEDGFLNGRLRIAQFKTGFRAGHDTVLLAAAVAAQPGSQVLELGAGAGVASLCLAARVSGVRILGIELDPILVGLAQDNAFRNGFAGQVRFELGDVENQALPPASFAHVFFNPPFHPATRQGSPNEARRAAMEDHGNAPETWTRIALGLVAPGGTLTTILRADRAEHALAAAGSNEAVLFPFFPRAGEAPKRAIVRIVKNGIKGLRRARGLVLHRSEGGNSAEAEAILRGAAALPLD